MGLLSFFKNLFGTAKDSAVDLAAQAENTIEQVVEAATPYIEKAETFAEETILKAKEASEPILESVSEYAHQAKEVVSDVIDSIKETTTEMKSDSETFATETVIDSSEKPLMDAD